VFLRPCGQPSKRLYKELVQVMRRFGSKYILYGAALKDDVHSSCYISARTKSHDTIVSVYEHHPPAGDSIQHESNAEFDEDDGSAVENFVKE
jgi:hypothetical protein